MILFRNFEMYHEINLPKENLFCETIKFLENLPDVKEIPGKRLWIVKIKGNLVTPDQGDLITHWPYCTELIGRYCHNVEKKQMVFKNITILVKAGYIINTKTLDPTKYYKLIHLINEFKKKNNINIRSIY